MQAVRLLMVLSAATLAVACAGPDNPQARGSNSMGSMGSLGSMGDVGSMPMGQGGSMAATDPRMKRMQEMHQRMMGAQSPAERQALMADHMKAMQDGMAMLQEMHDRPGPGGATSMEAMPGMGEGRPMRDPMARHMARHMAVMRMMMDMMADRMPPAK